MPEIDCRSRLRSLIQHLKKSSLDSLLVTNESNVSYLSGFFGHDAMLLIMPDKQYFITDSRYIEEAAEQVKGFDLKLVELSTYETLLKIIKRHHLRKLGFESMGLPFEVANRLRRYLSGKVSLMPVKDMVERLRTIKDRVEIDLIKDSIKVTKTVFDKTIQLFKPGVSEEFISWNIEIEFIKMGGRPGFESIVASDVNASKPHARPGEHKLRNNSFVMVDIGCKMRSYNSDMTRMVVLGKPKEKFNKIYIIVHAAQKRAIDMIKPGLKIRDLDNAARGYIHDKGFGKYFGHSLGHGVGMDVHEGPSISKSNEEKLLPGMIFTVEPAIYIPGFGGVRIEDMVLVTDNGCEVLTK